MHVLLPRPSMIFWSRCYPRLSSRTSLSCALSLQCPFVSCRYVRATSDPTTDNIVRSGVACSGCATAVGRWPKAAALFWFQNIYLVLSQFLLKSKVVKCKKGSGPILILSHWCSDVGLVKLFLCLCIYFLQSITLQCSYVL
jgi:hypothetical protein